MRRFGLLLCGLAGLAGLAAPEGFANAGPVRRFPPRPAGAGARVFPAGAGGADTLRVLALMVRFVPDEDEQTTGDGTFVLAPSAEAVIDPPPHDRAYFENQLEALANYYGRVSGGRLALETRVHPDALAVPRRMAEYAAGADDESVTRGMSEFFRDAVAAADSAGVRFSESDALVVFHAGVGRDVNFDYDPTPLDLPSVYLNEQDLRGHLPAEAFNAAGLSVENGAAGVPGGLVLPETESQDGYEIGLLGTAALMFGFRLGLPALWDTDNGRSGIGQWGLMDQGSGNFNGLIPAEPSAFEKARLGWVTPVTVSSGDGLRVACSAATSAPGVYKVPIREGEYYLVENRLHDPNGDGVALGRDAEGREVRFLADGRVEVTGGASVIVSVDGYDFGLPGSGLLIWHVDEAAVEAGLAENRVNADPDRRGVDLEEADGAQDIGHAYGFLSPGAGSETGVMHDAWYAGNEISLLVNPGESVRFGPDTHPDTRSNDGAETHWVFDGFSNPDTVMAFSVRNERRHAGFPAAFGPAGRAMPPRSGDFNGDGKPDLVVSSSSGSAGVFSEHGIPLLGGEGAEIPTPYFLVRPGGRADHGGEGSLKVDNNHDVDHEIDTDPGRILSADAGIGSACGIDPAKTGGSSTPVGPLSAAPVLWGSSADGPVRVVLAGETGLIAAWTGISGSGLPVLERLDDIGPDKALCLVALNGPSSAFLAAGTDGGGVRAYDASGRLLWRTQVFDGAVAGLAAIGSGNPDSLVAVSEEGWACLDAGGTVVSRSPLWGPLSGSANPVTGRFKPGERFRAWTAVRSAWAVFTPSGVSSGMTRPDFPEHFSVPAPGDADRDGDLDLCFTGGGALWWVDVSGAVFPGFPKALADPQAFPSSPVLGDVDGDGDLDAVVVVPDGRIEAIGPDGKAAEGFPLPAGSSPAPAPALLFDLDGDGLLECASVSDDGIVDVWDLDGPADSESPEWGAEARDGAGTGRSPFVPRSAVPGPDPMPGGAYNYPNPAYGDFTVIRYRLEKAARVSIEIFDLAGARVARFSGPGEAAADNEAVWDVRGRDSGVYFCRVLARGDGWEDSAMMKIAVVK